MTHHLTKTLAERLARDLRDLLAKIRRDAPELSGKLMGECDETLRLFDAAQQAAGEQALPPLPKGYVLVEAYRECGKYTDDNPGLRADCARKLERGEPCEKCPSRAAQAAQPLPVREAWTVFGWVWVGGGRDVFINTPENAKKLREQGHKVVEVYTRAALAQQPAQAVPIDMVLHCPACGQQHIDAPEDAECDGEAAQSFGWSNPPHRSHLCHGCGHIWRPADVPTNGVAAVKTQGKADSPIASHRTKTNDTP